MLMQLEQVVPFGRSLDENQFFLHYQRTQNVKFTQMTKILDLGRRFSHKVRDRVFYTKSPKYLTSPLYAKKFNAKWHKVYEQMPSKRSPPIYYGTLVVDLQRRLDSEFPEAGVLELNNALLYRKDGWIFSKEGYLLPDHSWYGRYVNEMMNVPKFLPRGKRLEGVCLSLASDFAVRGYGHFIIDCLSRLELFYKAGFKLTDVDHIFCPKPTPGNAQFLFSQLDLPANKCIWADQNVALRADTLLAPTFPGTRRNYPKWVPEFLHREFLQAHLKVGGVESQPQPSRRLFISRSGYTRNLENESSVHRILIQHGFEIYNPMEHTKSHLDFSEATTIVGVSGSALTGLAFCQPGTKVLELIPSDHVYPYYYTLSDAAGLEYGCLIGRSTNERNPDAWGPSPYNFSVDEDEFDNALTQITCETKSN